MDVFNNNGEVTPSSRDCGDSDTGCRGGERDVFNSNGEVYENACDSPPAAETVVTVTRAVDEESRDVRAGVLRYLIS